MQTTLKKKKKKKKPVKSTLVWEAMDLCDL